MFFNDWALYYSSVTLGITSIVSVCIVLSRVSRCIFLHCLQASSTWWPTVLASLRSKDLLIQLIELLRVYLQGRTVIYELGPKKMEKNLERGCPRGSRLGPMLWNCVVDQLIKVFDEGIGDDRDYTNIYAYADDLVITTKGNSTMRIEIRLNLALNNIVHNWTTRNKLTLSINKCNYMVYGEKMSRNTTIRIGSRNIVKVYVFKYLGLQIDTNRQLKHIRTYSTV